MSWHVGNVGIYKPRDKSDKKYLIICHLGKHFVFAYIAYMRHVCLQWDRVAN
jgi:hypothetical protein